MSVWQSPDAVLSPLNLHTYAYVHQRPNKFTDPDGREVVSSATAARAKYGAGTAGRGHHWVPFGSVSGPEMDVSSEARKVFGQSSGTGNANEIVANRGRQQEILNAEGFAPPVLDHFAVGDKGYEAVRGREQQLIDFYGGAQSVGGTARNKIQGISDFNPRRGDYLDAARQQWGDLPNNRPKP